MDKDNVRLALWISGVWGGLIIVLVGAEAIVHDGNIATIIVDTFSKVLFGLGAILGAITGVGKWVEGHVATQVVNNPTASAALPAVANGAVATALPAVANGHAAVAASLAAANAEPVSSPAGQTAVLAEGGGV